MSGGVRATRSSSTDRRRWPRAGQRAKDGQGRWVARAKRARLAGAGGPTVGGEQPLQDCRPTHPLGTRRGILDGQPACVRPGVVGEGFLLIPDAAARTHGDVRTLRDGIAGKRAIRRCSNARRALRRISPSRGYTHSRSAADDDGQRRMADRVQVQVQVQQRGCRVSRNEDPRSQGRWLLLVEAADKSKTVEGPKGDGRG